MNISEERRENDLVLAPQGRLDSLNAPVLDRRLSAAIDSGEHRLIIDFSELAYISSMGLSTLLSAAKKIKRVGGRIALVGLSERVHAVLEVSGFTRIFVIYPSVRDALDA